MKIFPYPADVLRLVVGTFQEFGVSADDLSQMTDTVLIQDGRIYGHSYRTGTLMAMWLVEVGILQFYAADGAMLRTVNLLQESPILRAAA